MTYNPGIAGGGKIATLSDVALSTPTEAAYLGYDATAQKWRNYDRPAKAVETVAVVATAGTAQTIADVDTATITALTLTDNCTLTFPTAAAGKTFMVTLKQDGTGSRTITWPNTVKWPGGAAPTFSTAANATDVVSFVCVDGTNWLGFMAGKGF